MPEYFALRDQACFWLVKSSGAELETSGYRPSALHISPYIQPRVVGTLPHVADKQALARRACCDPAEVVFDYEGDYFGLVIID
jgi:hypothetical protein